MINLGNAEEYWDKISKLKEFKKNDNKRLVFISSIGNFIHLKPKRQYFSQMWFYNGVSTFTSSACLEREVLGVGYDPSR